MTAVLTMRFTEWECGHHGTRPGDIPVSSPEQATLILIAISHAISQPGHCSAVLVSAKRAESAYVTDDYVATGYGNGPEFRAESDWRERPIVIHGGADEIDAIHSDALADAADSLFAGIDRWTGVDSAADFNVVTTVLRVEDIEGALAQDMYEYLPPIYRPASEVLAELREEAASLARDDEDDE